MIQVDEPYYEAVHQAALASLPPLLARWRERAQAAEAARSLPAATIRELHENGFLQLAMPLSVGGRGAAWVTPVEVARRAARACSSTAWTIGVVGVQAAIAGRLAKAATGAIFDGGRAS